MTQSVEQASAGLRFAIVASRFNSEITGGLVRGAREALEAAGVVASNIVLYEVPGAFELPLTAKKAAASGRFDGVVAIGCLIRGETPHFEYISQAASSGIMQAGLDTGVPVIFGLLTVNTDQQAEERSLPGPGNKGFEAGAAAVEMVRLLKQI